MTQIELWEEAIEEFDSALVQAGKSANTRTAYKRDLAGLAQTVGTQPASVTPSQLSSALMGLKESGLSAVSISRNLSSWRGFFEHMVQAGKLGTSPAVGLKAPKREKRLPRTLNILDMQAVLDSVQPKENAPEGLYARDKAMFELLYSSGLRLAELTGANLADIDPTEGLITVTGKGNRQRIVPVGKVALKAIQVWLQERKSMNPKTDALFISKVGDRLTGRQVHNRLHKWSMQSGIAKHINPHQFRHAFASHMLMNSGDLRGVQEMLGHVNVSSTAIYTALDYKHLQSVYSNAHPRGKKI